MTRERTARLWVWVFAAAIGLANVGPSVARAAAPETALTERGQPLEANYAAQLQALKSDIEKSLPLIPAAKKAAYAKAVETERAAEAKLVEAQNGFGAIGKANGLVHHAHWWIGDAEKNIAKAQAALKKATTPAERAAAQKTITEQQNRRDAGLEALKEREAALAKAKVDEPELTRARDAAEAALKQAKAQTQKALKDLGLESFLSSAGGTWDPQLVKCVVLMDATPRGLAAFAQQGGTQEQLIEQLLSDTDLMKQMLVADGPSDGKYGRAMQIYTAIQKASPKAKEGCLQRLALAVALEHAVPVKQVNPKDQPDAPATVDPVKRYLAYEKAYLDGELDPAFKDLAVWDYRFVVNGDEPDWTLAWGRKMLRNYRPDEVAMPDYRWRYVKAVATEVRYGSQDNKYDRPDLQKYQNMLMNGGVCGRRAFFGRSILRAFGIPTTARPQSGHAALTHWTPDGWVVNLGAGWGSGWTKTRYKKDLDFLANTQARAVGEAAFLKVKRAQWIGQVVGEAPVYGLESGKPDFWHGVALYEQRAIIEASEAKTLAAVGEDLGEANESKQKEAVEDVAVTGADRKIVVGSDGTITIPAVACSSPTKSTGKILFMKSNLGGMQLHYSRNGGAQPFEYTFEAPAAGKYRLVAKVVTPSWQQHLLVSANGASSPVDIVLPFTVGMWESTKPVEVALVKGKNVLRFSHKSEGFDKGVSIKDFTLTPLQ